MTLLITTLAGGLGALCRYVLSGLAQERSRSGFPVGTLSVNLAGAFLAGLVVGAEALPTSPAVAAVGFLGGFSTFSTWMVETIRLGGPLPEGRAVANLAITLFGGVALAAAGHGLTN